MQPLSAVIDQIRNHANRKQLCRDTGVSYPWVNQLLAGKIADPGYNRIKTVLDAITKPAEQQKPEEPTL